MKLVTLLVFISFIAACSQTDEEPNFNPEIWQKYTINATVVESFDCHTEGNCIASVARSSDLQVVENWRVMEELYPGDVLERNCYFVKYRHRESQDVKFMDINKGVEGSLDHDNCDKIASLAYRPTKSDYVQRGGK